MANPSDKVIEVPVGDDPSLREVSDRARMLYLGQLYSEEEQSPKRVAARLGCTVLNVHKATRYALNKFGDSEG